MPKNLAPLSDPEAWIITYHYLFFTHQDELMDLAFKKIVVTGKREKVLLFLDDVVFFQGTLHHFMGNIFIVLPMGEFIFQHIFFHCLNIRFPTIDQKRLYHYWLIYVSRLIIPVINSFRFISSVCE